jgi:peptidylprolyl isomerase domain and WD repeat-containing protein 1
MKRGREEAGEDVEGVAEEERDQEAPQVVGEPSVAPATASAVTSSVRAALARLPSSEMYEKSYMHRDWVTHVVVTRTDFVITASRDGQLKFWKKMQAGIEFVKHFRAHMAPFAGLAASADGSLLASTSSDRGLKVFDVLAFDMIAWIKLDFTPGVCEWVGGSGSGAHSNAGSRSLLAVADVASPQVCSSIKVVK